MGLFGKNKKEEAEELNTPVASSGKINGLTKLKGRGFILEAGTQESLFFNKEGCADFETLEVGQNVSFMKERDPGDRLRKHAIDVRAV
jgi:cold shock CspA family protein